MVREKVLNNRVETILIEDVDQLTYTQIFKKKIEAIRRILFSSNYILHYKESNINRVRTVSLNCNIEMIKTNRNSLDYLEHSVQLQQNLNKILQ